MSPSTKKVARNVDIDPLFDNTNLSMPEPGGGLSKRPGATKRTPPYHPGNTFSAPNGDANDYKTRCKNLTALQGHVAYFDGDCDGIIWPTDTFLGFYYLGFGIFLSLLSMLIIHPPFHYPTMPYNGDRLINFLPDPFMRIYVANIHRDKHGSDSESYNRRGQFQKQKFEEVINDFSSATNKDALSFGDVMSMFKIRRNLLDIFGVFGFFFEWLSMMGILALHGRLTPQKEMKVEDILGILDGSIFPVLAYEYKSKKRSIAFLPQRVR